MSAALADSESLHGQTILLTGGTRGLGEETAKTLADRGASLAIVGRDRKRGNRVAADLDERTDGSVEFYRVDLGKQDSVRRLADRFSERHDSLDVLVNNAGVSFSKRQETDDGIEATFAINHLAPYLLTHELLDLLLAGDSARVVTTSSEVHSRAELDFSDLQCEADYDGMSAYARSKLANLYFTYELADRLHDTDVTANAVNPGFVPSTGLKRGTKRRTRLMFSAFDRLPLPFTKDVADGASTLIRVSADPHLAGATGEYFDDNEATESSPASYDETARKRLWDVSAGFVGVSPDWV